MTARPRILVLAPASRPFSYARVARSILLRLAERYEIHQFAFDGGEEEASPSLTLHRSSLRGDPYGVDQLPALIEAISPAVLVIVNDIELYYRHRRALARFRDDLKVLLHCPVDGDDMLPAYAASLRDLDGLVVFTTFAKQVIRTAWERLADERRSGPWPPIDVIPHGVDTESFYPLSGDVSLEGFRRSRLLAREALFPERRDLGNAFIVLNANQNNIRKRLDVTIAGFALFARDKPANVRLYLHCNTREKGCDLRPFVKFHEIEDRLLTTTRRNQSLRLPDGKLNLLYNACDVGANTSAGEGWGLVAFEHGATGAAQIQPRHSACQELWDDDGCLLATAPMRRSRNAGVRHRVPSPEALASALEDLYRCPSKRFHYALAAHRKAGEPAYRWESIALAWHRLIQRTLQLENGG